MTCRGGSSRPASRSVTMKFAWKTFGTPMLHIVLEHDPAVEDQRVIEEGFLTAQAARVGDPRLDGFSVFSPRCPAANSWGFAGPAVVELVVRRTVVAGARPARPGPWSPPAATSGGPRPAGRLRSRLRRYLRPDRPGLLPPLRLCGGQFAGRYSARPAAVLPDEDPRPARAEQDLNSDGRKTHVCVQYCSPRGLEQEQRNGCSTWASFSSCITPASGARACRPLLERRLAWPTELTGIRIEPKII